MALQKNSVSINFQRGLDTKTDALQLPIGNFEVLENISFDKVGKLKKRNGFPDLNELPDSTSRYLTTFKGGLVAMGRDLKTLAQDSDIWTSQGYYRYLQFAQVPAIRGSYNQAASDIAVSAQGLACIAFLDNEVIGSTVVGVPKITVVDANNGQSVVAPYRIVSSQGSAIYQPRAFRLNNNFIVAFTVSSASSTRLQYTAISAANPTVRTAPMDINTSYAATQRGAFDGVVAGQSIYFAWNAASNAGLQVTGISSQLLQGSIVTISSLTSEIVTMTADTTVGSPVLWVTGYTTGSNTGFALAATSTIGSAAAINLVLPTTRIIDSASPVVTNMTIVAKDNVASVFYENANSYTFGISSTNFIARKDVAITGSVFTIGTIARGVGLASKAFFIGSETFLGATYQSEFQDTNFVLSSLGAVVSKYNYGNATGYFQNGLPNVSVNGLVAKFPYQTKTTLQSVNKGTALGSQTPIAAVYSQSGTNIASLDYTFRNVTSAEIGNSLNLNGGMLWSFDGNTVGEHGFHLYPEPISLTVLPTTGSVSPGTYYYRATYEFTDAQGNIVRSAPSVPVTATISSGLSNSVSVQAPTYRLTYKPHGDVRVVVYRWSQAQPVYYQTTSITVPTISSTSIDSVTITDKNRDADILGNNILYTTGNVLENIEPPPIRSMTLFDSRLWTISGENTDILLYSKQIVPNTPVEMSDLLTFFVSPTSAAQGPTGPLTALAPMDDKLLVFKRNAIYYISGIGPDATGANSQYSEPVFVTSTVGCENQNSIVTTPIGVLFQSDKGIWIVNRGLATEYIGKNVERFNSSTVTSAVAVPGTNEVRFSLDTGEVLSYDYFVGQWSTFSNVSNVSSTIYDNAHTIVTDLGAVQKETAGVYVDGSRPTVIRFQTGWISPSGIQGFAKLYEMYLLGTYKSPHILTAGIEYNYKSGISQLASIVPDNFSGVWGSSTNWGSVSFWGGNSQLEQWRINFGQKSAQSFRLTVSEYFDPTKGVESGSGVEISALNFVIGVKQSFPRNISATNRTG